jgi:hypothetical protein
MTDRPKDLTTPAHRKLFAALTDVMNQHGDLGKSFVLAERPDLAAEPPPGKTCVLWGIDPNDGSRVCLKWQ